MSARQWARRLRGLVSSTWASMSADTVSRMVRRRRDARRRRRLTPRIRVDSIPRVALVRLGTRYGGWTFAESRDLHGASVIAAGAGEDISFDVAFAARYGATVHIVDPTPRAQTHVGQVLDRIARGDCTTNVMDQRGKVDVGAYEIGGLTAGQLRLWPFALWNETTTVRFHVPRNPAHVSHSIINYQREEGFISVPAVTITGLVHEAGLREIPLIKLDIEGAEVEVIEQMLAGGLFPGQLLVEFDEMHTPSERSRERIASSIERLRAHRYLLAHWDHRSNFLFIRRP